MIRPFAGGVALAFLAAPAQAQGGERGGQPGSFDFYVLALSWSPTFCELKGEGRGDEQCRPGRKLGFVVHGLWPQYEQGFPTECGAYPRPPSRADLEEAEGVFPSAGLARHEWRRHGTCTGNSPGQYFRDARRALEQVTIPARFARGGGAQRLTPLDVERAFAEANPGLRTDMMAVACRRGLLEEVRICFERNLRGFRTCPEVDRSGCRGGEVTVGAGP